MAAKIARWGKALAARTDDLGSVPSGLCSRPTKCTLYFNKTQVLWYANNSHNWLFLSRLFPCPDRKKKQILTSNGVEWVWGFSQVLEIHLSSDLVEPLFFLLPLSLHLWYLTDGVRILFKGQQRVEGCSGLLCATEVRFSFLGFNCFAALVSSAASFTKFETLSYHGVGIVHRAEGLSPGRLHGDSWTLGSIFNSWPVNQAPWCSRSSPVAVDRNIQSSKLTELSGRILSWPLTRLLSSYITILETCISFHPSEALAC